MKTSLLTAVLSTMFCASAFAATNPAPAPAKAPAPAPLPAHEIFGEAVQKSFSLSLLGEGFRIARCECEETETVCERPCKEWDNNGNCTKRGLPECFKVCKKWSCEEKH